MRPAYPHEKPDATFALTSALVRVDSERAVCITGLIVMIHYCNLHIAAWATRALIVRKLKGLEDFIGKSRAWAAGSATPMLTTSVLPAGVSVVSPKMGAKGWPFASADAYPGADLDPLYDAKHVSDLYLRAKPDYDGRYAFSTPPLHF